MEETVRCSGCQAQLTLPSLPPGQTVQCPRCQHVFEPFRQRATPAIPAAPISQDAADDHGNRPAQDWPSIVGVKPPGGGRLAILTMAMLGAAVLCFGLEMHARIEQIQLLEMERDLGLPRVIGPGFQFNLRRNAMDRLHADFYRYSCTLAIAHSAIGCLTLLLFLVWLYRAASNARQLRALETYYSPVLAFGSFFIPLANLFLPCMIIQEIWKASNPIAIETPVAWKERPRSLLVRLWWFSYLIGGIFSFVSARWYEMTPDGDLPAKWKWLMFWWVSMLIMIVAALLLIVLIREITQRQKERYANLLELARHAD
jgi:hypothetical protein